MSCYDIVYYITFTGNDELTPTDNLTVGDDNTSESIAPGKKAMLLQ